MCKSNEPRRGEIWHVVDNDRSHDGDDRHFDSSVQGGTRLCIVVSNDNINKRSDEVEVVYTTTKKKTDIPTHFYVNSAPKPSIVLCEQIMTVPKKNLTWCYGSLMAKEMMCLFRCLRISVNLHKVCDKLKADMRSEIPHRNEIWNLKDGRQCVIISNNTGNTFSSIIEVVYLTNDDAVKATHFKTEPDPKSLTGLCDRIMTISKTELLDCQRKLTKTEIDRINNCIKISLGIS